METGSRIVVSPVSLSNCPCYSGGDVGFCWRFIVVGKVVWAFLRWYALKPPTPVAAVVGENQTAAVCIKGKLPTLGLLLWCDENATLGHVVTELAEPRKSAGCEGMLPVVKPVWGEVKKALH